MSYKTLLWLWFVLPFFALLLVLCAFLFAAEGSFLISFAVMCCAASSLIILALINELLSLTWSLEPLPPYPDSSAPHTSDALFYC